MLAMYDRDRPTRPEHGESLNDCAGHVRVRRARRGVQTRSSPATTGS
jgi:hypothetical protein